MYSFRRTVYLSYWNAKDESEGMRKQEVAASFKNYPTMCLEGLRKPTTHEFWLVI